MRQVVKVFKNLTQSELNRLLTKGKVRSAAKLGMKDVEFDVQEHSSEKKRQEDVTHMYPTFSFSDNKRTLLPFVSYFNVTMRYSI